MFSGGLSLNVLAFIRMKHLECLDETMSFLNAHTALLCLLILKMCMWLCLQFNNTCNHVSGSKELHIEHVLEG